MEPQTDRGPAGAAAEALQEGDEEKQSNGGGLPSRQLSLHHKGDKFEALRGHMITSCNLSLFRMSPVSLRCLDWAVVTRAMLRPQDFTGRREIQTQSEKTPGTEKSREREIIFMKKKKMLKI